jgi:3-isopropylmalate/(R)-2-methylmalate dehydratase small subunit
MTMHGRAHKFGRDVNIDDILPLSSESGVLIQITCGSGLDAAVLQQVRRGDFIVGTTNFGCGSHRVEALSALMDAGVSAIIASSFARIFYRNAVNMGLPLLESPTAAEIIESGDELEVDLDANRIADLTKAQRFVAAPMPEFARQVAEAGGLLRYASERHGSCRRDFEKPV